MSKWQHILGGYDGRVFVKLVIQEGFWNLQGLLRDIKEFCLWYPVMSLLHKLTKSIQDTSHLCLLDNIIFVYLKWFIVHAWLELTIFTCDMPLCVFDIKIIIITHTTALFRTRWSLFFY
jgi:hypothetical protein